MHTQHQRVIPRLSRLCMNAQISRKAAIVTVIETLSQNRQLGERSRPCFYLWNGINVRLQLRMTIRGKHLPDISATPKPLFSPHLQNLIPYPLFEIRDTIRFAKAHYFQKPLTAVHRQPPAFRTRLHAGIFSYYPAGEIEQSEDSDVVSLSILKGALLFRIEGRLVCRVLRITKICQPPPGKQIDNHTKIGSGHYVAEKVILSYNQSQCKDKEQSCAHGTQPGEVPADSQQQGSEDRHMPRWKTRKVSPAVKPMKAELIRVQEPEARIRPSKEL